MKDIQENGNTSHLIKQLKSIKGDICVLNDLLMIDTRRIILPTKAIKPVLNRLHAGHPGQEKTITLAQQLYYWQNMTNDIKTVVENCNECQERRPKQQTNQRVTNPPSSAFGAPMAHVAAVKNVKLLLSKCSVTKEDPQRALYYWRNIPRKDGYSPAQLLMGRKQFTQLPAAPVHYEFYDPANAQVSKDKAFDAAQKAHDQHASFLPMLQPGSLVSLQDPQTGLWNQEGVVTKVRGDKLSYSVQVGNRLFVRSRKMLKLIKKATTKTDSHSQSINRATAANTCKRSLPHSFHSKQATRGNSRRQQKSRGQSRSQRTRGQSREQPRTRGQQPRGQQVTKELQRNPQSTRDQPLTTFTPPQHSPCLLYTSPSPRDLSTSRMPSSA